MRRLFSVILCLAGAVGVLRAEPITLEACLREVMARNPDIARARADLERAAGDRLVIRSRGLPRLRLDGIIGYQGDRGPTRSATEIAVGYANASQPLFDLGVLPSFRRGDLGLEIARQNFFQTAVERLHAARSQYYLLQFRGEQASVLRQIKAQLDENTSVQADLERAGLGPRRGTLQAQVQSLGLAPAVADAEANGTRARIALRQLLGRSGPDPDPAPADALIFPAVAAEPAAAAREALEQRADLAALRATIAALREDQRVIEAAYFPLIEARIGLTGVPQSNRASTNPNALRAIDSNMVNEFRYGVALAWQVVDNGTVTGQARATAASRGALEQTLARAEADIPRDLARLRATVAANRAKLSAYADAERGSRDTFRTVNELVRAGKGSQLEVINAQTNLLSAQQGTLFTRLEQSLVAAELDRVTGRYLRFVSAPSRAK